MNKWIAQGHRLDLVRAFHNVECEEIPNIQCPIIDWRRAAAMRELNGFVLSRLTGLVTSDTIWMTGFLDERFSGWCYRHVGNLVTIYETNSRFPSHRLELAQLQQAGALFTGAFTEYLASPRFQAICERYRCYAKYACCAGGKVLGTTKETRSSMYAL